MENGKLKVIELFAGVGGFRLGLENSDKSKYEFVFANQWEPNKKNQHAFECYIENFGSENTFNNDIAIDKFNIVENADLLVGGFPCQDYSVASTNAKGIIGKKGVLWWEISWILEHKKPKMVLLENVDRLLISPSSSRGRDFAIMLFNLNKLGYNVEWQVINAADYGFVQRRKRVFIFGTRRDYFSNLYDEKLVYQNLYNSSIFSKCFDTEIVDNCKQTILDLNINYTNELDLSLNWGGGSNFYNKGYCINGIVYTYDCQVVKTNDFNLVLKDIILKNVDQKYVLTNEQLEKMKYLKGSKKIVRTKSNGEEYIYSEGSMCLYDSIFKKSRTMLTSESSVNRTTHILKINEYDDSTEGYRFLTPIEAERLNGFPDNWTKSIKTEKMRYFVMGNALVVNIISILSKRLIEIYNYQIKNTKINKNTNKILLNL